MAIARNKKEEEEIKNNDLAKKLASEVPLALSIRRLFRQIGDDFAAEYAVTGNVLNLNAYSNDLTSILRDSYRKTAKKFKFNIRESLEEPVNEEIKFAIDNNISQYIKNHSIEQNNIILNTTNNDLYNDLNNVIIDAAIIGESLSRVETAMETRKVFTKKAINRSETIAETETQNISETTKTIEQDGLIDGGVVVAGVAIVRALEKIWKSAFLPTTRSAHAAADGQKRSLKEPFIVGGERFQQPGDTTLGASIANWINCHCSLVYRFK